MATAHCNHVSLQFVFRKCFEENAVKALLELEVSNLLGKVTYRYKVRVLVL